MKSKIVSSASLALLIALAFVAVNYSAWKQQLSDGYTVVSLHPEKGKPLSIKAEIADTPEGRATGLMFRESLEENEGMLFVFPDSAVRNFWMKNTLIPLDMIFISENMTIVRIHYALPCTSDPCPLYSSEKPVRYVLEVGGNFTAENGIEEGGVVTLKD